MIARRPFLSLILCLALAVNLLAPLASAHPAFTQICTEHGIVLIPAEDAPDPGICEFCPVACATALAPEGWTLRLTGTRPVGYDTDQAASVAVSARPDRHARAPPSLPV